MKNNIFKLLLFIVTIIIIFCTLPAFLICMYEKYDAPLFLNIYNKFNFSYSYEFRSARFLYNHIFVVICLLTTLTFASLDIFTSLKNSKSKIKLLFSVICDLLLVSIVIVIVSNTFYAAWIYQY